MKKFEDIHPSFQNAIRQHYKTAYGGQKRSAKERNIDWGFKSFDEWFDWWGDDIVNRGPYKGQLVMARLNDIGPYHPNNIRKEFAELNSREANLGKKRDESKIKNRKKLQTPNGVFKSRRHAAEFYNISAATISCRLRDCPGEYYYI